MKEEKLVKHTPSELTFTKNEIEKILTKTKGVAESTNLDCKTQVIQKVGMSVFEIILGEMSDRKTKFGILKLFRIAKAVIKTAEESIQLWRECNKPV